MHSNTLNPTVDSNLQSQEAGRSQSKEEWNITCSNMNGPINDHTSKVNQTEEDK